MQPSIRETGSQRLTRKRGDGHAMKSRSRAPEKKDPKGLKCKEARVKSVSVETPGCHECQEDALRKAAGPEYSWPKGEATCNTDGRPIEAEGHTNPLEPDDACFRDAG